MNAAASDFAPAPARPWWESRGVALIALAIGWFYLWTATSGSEPLGFQLHGLDYYNLLTDGFLDGQLSLKYTGTPGIERLANPYDPEQNAPYRVLDMSYYKGKYYIYFGPTPALVLLLPWRVLTGFHLPSHLAVVIFCIGGYWLSIALLLRWRDRYFPGLPVGAVWLAVALLGLADMAPALLRRPLVYEVAISCGYFFIMLALLALDRAAVAARGRWRWLAVASAAYGLAILARPTCIYGAIIFPLVLLWWWRRDRRERPPRGIGWPTLVAAAVPLGACFGLMLLYNYLRFGRPLEFGQIYQLTGRDMSQVKGFSLGYFRFDAWLYLLMPAQYSFYFPFFLNAVPPPMPPGYDGLDDLYGLLPNLPVVLLAAGVVWPGPRLIGRARTDFFGWCTVLAGAVVAVFGVFLFFSGATIRYYLDFLPAWILLACLGLWSIGSWAIRPIARGAVWTVLVAVAVYSMAFATLVSFQHGGLLRAVNRAAFDGLAMVANRVPWLYEHVAGVKYGPVRVTLRFPANEAGKFEPLLVSGAFPNVDYLWVLYKDDHHLQLGYEHTGGGGPVSQPILVDYTASHVLDVDAGILYPPEAHPDFAGHPGEARERSRRLLVRLDGVPYLDTSVSRYDPVSPRVHFGRNDITDTFGRRFTGKVEQVRRVAPTPTVDYTPHAGPAKLSVIWPEGRVGHREPLVVTGKTGQGDLLYVEYLPGNRARFGLDHWGVGAVISPPVPILPDTIQVLDVDLGSLYGPNASAPRRLDVRLDGQTVFATETDFHPATIASQTFAENLIGGSSCESTFTGKLVGLVRNPP